MTEPTNEAVDDGIDQTEGAQASASLSHTHRDMIVDRTGELLESAVETAEKIARPAFGFAQDPRDGTAAPIILMPGSNGQPGRYEIIQPSALDPYRSHPVALQGNATSTRLDSFIKHTERFATTATVIFANDDPQRPSLTTIFDYHGATEPIASPDNLKHRLTYRFPLSEEYVAWTSKNDAKMTMIDFAQFLEDHIVDVSADTEATSDGAKDFVAAVGGKMASPSKLMEIARGLQVNETSQVREVRNLSSGEAELVFTAEHVDANGAKLNLPNLFVICIPVFARSPDYYRLIARLRYRKSSSGIVFWYELWRPDLVFEQAFSEACDHVAAETGLPLFFGTPEA